MERSQQWAATDLELRRDRDLELEQRLLRQILEESGPEGPPDEQFPDGGSVKPDLHLDEVDDGEAWREYQQAKIEETQMIDMIHKQNRITGALLSYTHQKSTKLAKKENMKLMKFKPTELPKVKTAVDEDGDEYFVEDRPEADKEDLFGGQLPENLEEIDLDQIGERIDGPEHTEAPEAATIVGDNESMVGSKIIDGSVIDALDEDMLQQLEQVRGVKQAIFSENQLENMKQIIESEVKKEKDALEAMMKRATAEEERLLALELQDEKKSEQEYLKKTTNSILIAGSKNDGQNRYRIDDQWKNSEFEKEMHRLAKQQTIMDMEREDRLSYEREYQEFNQLFQNRNYSLPLSFNLGLPIKEFFSQIPSLDIPIKISPLNRPLKPIEIKPLPSFRNSEILSIETKSNKGKELLRGSLGIHSNLILQTKKVAKDHSEPFNDRIMSKAVQEHRSEDILQELSFLTQDTRQATQVEIGPDILWDTSAIPNHLEINSLGFELESLLSNGEPFCREINQKLKSSDVADKTVRMLASSAFPTKQLCQDITGSGITRRLDATPLKNRDPDSKLLKYSVKVEDMPSLDVLQETLPSSINILEAPLNQMSRLVRSGAQISTLSELSSMFHLDLSHNHLSSYKELEQTPLLHLVLSSNRISELSKVGLPGLLRLELSNNKICKLEHLEYSPMVRHLDLSGNCIDSIHGTSGLKWLETLDLSRNQIRVLQGIFNGNHPLLQTLVLFGNKIEAVTEDLVSASLRELHLADNCLQIIDFKMVCPQLSYLSLKGNPLKEVVSSLKWCIPNMKALSLSYTELEDRELLRLTGISDQLEQIDCQTQDPQKTKHIEVLMMKVSNLVRTGGKMEKINNRSLEVTSRSNKTSFWNTSVRRGPKSLIESAALNRYKFCLDLVEEHKRTASSQFGSEIQPNLDRVQLHLEKFIKTAEMPAALTHMEFFRAHRTLAPLKVSLPDLYMMKSNFEKHCQQSIRRIVRFLANVFKRIRARRQHFEKNSSKILTIQKNWRGHSVRRKYTPKSRFLLKHSKNIAKVVMCQKLIRGFIIRRRYKRFFCRVQDDLPDVDLGGINLREFDDMRLQETQDDFFSEIQQMINEGLKDHQVEFAQKDIDAPEKKEAKKIAVSHKDQNKLATNPPHPKEPSARNAAGFEVSNQTKFNPGGSGTTTQPSAGKQPLKPSISIKAHPGVINRQSPVANQGPQTWKASATLGQAVKPPSSTASSTSSTSSRMFGMHSQAVSEVPEGDNHSLSQYSIDTNSKAGSVNKKPGKLPVRLCLTQPIGQAVQDVYEGLGCKDETVKFAIEMKLKKDMMRKKKLQKLSAAERLENFQKNSLRGG